MAEATTFSFDLDLRGLARNGMRRAGILSETDEPSSPEVQMCGEFLNLQLKSWQLAGKLLRQTERKVLTMDATARSTGVVSVASDTIDVEFPISMKLTSGDQRYRIERWTRKDFLDQSNRTETGIPTNALIERAATVTLTLWPIPDTSVESIEVVRVFLIRDAKDGFTTGVYQRCLNAVVTGLAVDLCEWAGKDDAKINRLQTRYAFEKAEVLTDNNERGDVKFSLR